MKTIKFLLVSLFMMLGLAAQAQQVVITKTDGTVDVFKPNEVDSIVYNPTAKLSDTAGVYYYLGDVDDFNKTTKSNWTKVTSGTSFTINKSANFMFIIGDGKVPSKIEKYEPYFDVWGQGELTDVKEYTSITGSYGIFIDTKDAPTFGNIYRITF